MTPKYGIFLWRGDGRYNVHDAVAQYAGERVAQRKADALNEAEHHEFGYVVRTLAYCSAAEVKP